MLHWNDLNITTVKGRIDINTVKPLMSDRYLKADVDRKTNNPRFDIQSKNIKCDIDSSMCRAQEGLKSESMLMEDFANEGLQAAKEVAKKAAYDGQMMLKTFKNGNYKVSEQKQKLKQLPSLTGIKFIPTVRPTITWEENDIQTYYHPLSYDFNWNTHNFADINVVRKNDIDIEVNPKPEIRFEYVGDMFKKLDVRA